MIYDFTVLEFVVVTLAISLFFLYVISCGLFIFLFRLLLRIRYLKIIMDRKLSILSAIGHNRTAVGLVNVSELIKAYLVI